MTETELKGTLQKVMSSPKVYKKIGNYWTDDFKWRHFQVTLFLAVSAGIVSMGSVIWTLKK